MKSYVLKVELEPHEDGWHAFYGPWRKIGASIWGSNIEEVLRYTQEILEMVVEELLEEGKEVPEALGIGRVDHPTFLVQVSV